MSDGDEAGEGLLGAIRHWLREGMVRDVPVEYSACEFECRVNECRHGHWTRCARRLRASGDGGSAG